MRRVHLLEIEDQPWCPAPVRDGGTDWLHFMANRHRAFNAMAPKLRAVIERCGVRGIVDLCSGGGGPWLALAPLLAQPGSAAVRLTDSYPNVTALRRVSAESRGRIVFSPDPVDAAAVPEGLDGLRTIFNAFHHFRPQEAQAILADAVTKRRPIAIVEGADNRLLGILLILLMPLAMLVLTPLIRPFRWSRILLTYLLPVIPLLALFDGTVSMLRIYSPDELREMIARIPGSESFEWDIGIQRVRGSPIGLTYLIGAPAAPS